MSPAPARRRDAGRARAGAGSRILALAAAACALASGTALGEWLQPDPSLREAQFVLRMAQRDTVGHPDDHGRLDSLGVALLRLGRAGEASAAFERVLALRPGDDMAEAGLGKLALFAGRLDDAERLLAGADPADPGAQADRFALRMRRGDWAGAAELAPAANHEGRIPMLERMAARTMYEITGPNEAVVPWTSAYPVPLVRVKLNGQRVLMALDTGTDDLLIDEAAARRYKVESVPSQSVSFWTGARTVVRGAIVQRLEIGGIRIANVPAGTKSLGRWSMEVNPHGERVAGIIGLGLLRQFTPTLDYKAHRLELRRGGAAATPAEGAHRVPFELWGISELMVRGTMSGSRSMAMIVQTGVPGCGVGASAEVFDEIGVRPGAVAKLVKGAGTWLHGRPWSEVVVPTVTVGPIARDKVDGWLGALDAGELWRHGVRRDALLSNDFFRDLRMTIDWDARTLIVEE